MRTWGFVGAAIGMMVLLSACGPGPGSQATAEAVCAAYETASFHGDYKTMYSLLAPVDNVYGTTRQTLEDYLPDWQKVHAQKAGGQINRVEITTPFFGGSAVSKNCKAYYSLPGKLTIQLDLIGVDELADGEWYVVP